MIAHPVLREELAQWRPRCEHFVRQIVEGHRDELPEDEVWRLLADDRMTLWLAVHEDGDVYAAALAQVVPYPNVQRRDFWCCEMFGCAGKEMQQWVGLMVSIRDWAEHAGCKRIKLIARPGWEKIMRDRGFIKTHVILEQDLNGKVPKYTDHGIAKQV